MIMGFFFFYRLRRVIEYTNNTCILQELCSSVCFCVFSRGLLCFGCNQVCLELHWWQFVKPVLS